MFMKLVPKFVLYLFECEVPFLVCYSEKSCNITRRKRGTKLIKLDNQIVNSSVPTCSVSINHSILALDGLCTALGQYAWALGQLLPSSMERKI